MRLNRVLLLAASINMAMLATVFTISCSGDDGKSGASCEAREADNGGVDIFCGGVKQGNVPPGAAGADGTDGQTGGGGTYTIGACKVTQSPYNDYEQKIECPNQDALFICSGRYFEPSEQFCTNGGDHQYDINNTSYPKTPGSDYAGGTLEALYSGLVYKFKCNSIEYHPNEKFCHTVNGEEELEVACGGATFQSTQFCLFGGRSNGGDIVVFKCRNGSTETDQSLYSTYDKTQFCQSQRSDSEGYDEPTAKSINAKVVSLCGGKTWGYEMGETEGSPNELSVSNETECSGGKKMQKCVNELFDIETQFCQRGLAKGGTAKPGVVKPFCGDAKKKSTYNDNTLTENETVTSPPYTGTTYTPELNTRCTAGVVETQCGTGVTATDGYSPASWYNASTHFCRPKAGRAASSVEKETAPICYVVSGGAIQDGSGDKPRQTTTFTPPSSFEVPGFSSATDFVGGKYDGRTYHCDQTAGKISKKCGSLYYVDSEKFCYGETFDPPLNLIGDKCVDDQSQYDPRTSYCAYKTTTSTSDGKITVSNAPAAKCDGVKINETKWEWNYCQVNATTGASATIDCGVGEVPNSPGNLSDNTCKVRTECAAVIDKYVSVDGLTCKSDCSGSLENIQGTKCVNACNAAQNEVAVSDTTSLKNKPMLAGPVDGKIGYCMAKVSCSNTAPYWCGNATLAANRYNVCAADEDACIALGGSGGGGGGSTCTTTDQSGCTSATCKGLVGFYWVTTAGGSCTACTSPSTSPTGSNKCGVQCLATEDGTGTCVTHSCGGADSQNPTQTWNNDTTSGAYSCSLPACHETNSPSVGTNCMDKCNSNNFNVGNGAGETWNDDTTSGAFSCSLPACHETTSPSVGTNCMDKCDSDEFNVGSGAGKTWNDANGACE